MQKRKSKNVTTKKLSDMLILIKNMVIRNCAYISNWFWNKSTLPELMTKLPGLMSKKFPLLLGCFYFSPMYFAY